MSDEFPSFKKHIPSQTESKNKFSFLILAGALAVTALFIFLSFRFLVGSKTNREEILAGVLSSSQSRQSSLLLEWIQNIDQSPAEWKPTAAEQKELLHFVSARKQDLAADIKSPALFALHVASWGPGPSNADELNELYQTRLSEESRLAVLLFHLRQKDFSEAARSFEMTQMQVSDFSKETDTYRKIRAAYLAQCVESGGEAVKSCTTSLLGYLGDEVDEVRWNAALGVLRAKLKDASYFHESEIDTARSELDKLYALLKNGDTTLLSRFQGVALESLAEEVFKIKIAFSPEQTKAELKEISNSHPDLRVRNIARNLAK